MESGGTITVNDVAKRAGVSVATVSRAFNNLGAARTETSKNVLKAAADLGYVRLRAKSGRSEGNRKKSVFNISLLISEDRADRAGRNSIYYDLFDVIHQDTEKEGFNISISTYSCLDPLSVSAVFQEQTVDGVIILSDSRPDFLSLVDRYCPSVLLNNVVEWPPRTCVAPDNKILVFKAVEHLVALGHKRIAFFNVSETISKDEFHSHERRAFYQEAMEHFGLGGQPELSLSEEFSYNGHHKAISRVLDRVLVYEEPPTAIITSLGYSVSFACQLQARRVKIPEQMSILATDESEMAQQMHPPLTTVSSRLDACMRNAIRLLCEKTKDPDCLEKVLRIEPQLIVRKSTAPVPGKTGSC